MAIAYPRTDVLNVGFADQTFQMFARQTLSRTAYGRTIGKSMGSAIWTANYTTGPMPNDDALDYEARLNSLDGVTGLFAASDLRRPMPRAYPDGACNNGVLASVNANNKALALSGLAASQIVSRGDYLSFDYAGSRALHQVMETVTANGGGSTGQFEVRPFIRPGWTAGTAVTLKNPTGLFSLMPGSVSSRPTGGIHSTVSFQVVQAI